MDERALTIMFAALGIGTLFSSLHACLENTTGAALEELVNSESRRGSRAASTLKIAESIPRHAYAVALMRILANLGVAVAAVFVSASVRTGSPPTLTDGLIGVIGSAALLWVFGVSISESIGRYAPERFLYAFSPLVRAVYFLQQPLSPLAHLFDAIVRKLAGVRALDKEEEVAEEILSITEEGERKGAIDEDERRMIEAVVNFKQRTVEQIMTPRSEIEALEYTNNLGAINAFVRKVRHSRIPVYRLGGGLDDVIGFFYIKDLLRWLAGDGPRTGGSGGGFELKQILRPALHVPHSKTIRELADEFVAKKVHAAVVVDEYGAVMGLVTLEDIIEDVFGDIQDEYEKTEDATPRIEIKLDEPGAEGQPVGMADVDARTYVADANEALEPLGINIPEDDEYDTVGGFVLSTLGHMPEVNETFSHGRAQFTVLEASPTRVLKVRVHVRPEEPLEEPPAALRPEPSADRAK